MKCSQCVWEAEDKHRFLAIQWRWIQVDDPLEMEPEQRGGVPGSSFEVRGQLWFEQQCCSCHHPNRQEEHHWLWLPWGIPLPSKSSLSLSLSLTLVQEAKCGDATLRRWTTCWGNKPTLERRTLRYLHHLFFIMNAYVIKFVMSIKIHKRKKKKIWCWIFSSEITHVHIEVNKPTADFRWNNILQLIRN